MHEEKTEVTWNDIDEFQKHNGKQTKLHTQRIQSLYNF